MLSHAGRVTGFVEFGNKHRINNPNDNCEDPYEEIDTEENIIDKCQSFVRCRNFFQ